MMDEPYSGNHQRQHEDPEPDPSLQSDLDTLASRLSADGATWRRRLPDTARIVERIGAIPYESPAAALASEGVSPMSNDTNDSFERRPLAPPRHSRAGSLAQRLSGVVAVAVVLALVGGMAFAFYAVRHSNGGTGATSPTATLASGAMRVSSVSMSVTPASIAGATCGTKVTVTYTALFHLTSNSAGGTIKFNYTVNNGRGETPASITVAPGESSKSYTFTWSGALPADHTYPGPGGVAVSSPNQLTSALVAPTGQCAPLTPPVCGSNFSSPISQSYQNTLTTDFGVVPLPPLSRTVPNNASGGQRGYDICSAGSAASVASFMQQNLPAYGWTFVSGNGGTQTWRNSKGVITWSVSNPLDWNIGWRVPLG
jgi:hypothetical protein